MSTQQYRPSSYSGGGSRNGGSGRVSLSDDYDGRRCVNTPLSLHACQLEGVDPLSLTLDGATSRSRKNDDDELVNPNNNSNKKTRSISPPSSSRAASAARKSNGKDPADAIFDSAIPLTKEQQQIKEKFIERRRQILLASVLRTYKKLTSPRNTLPPPPLSLTGELPEGAEGDDNDSPRAASARRKKFTNKPKSVTSTLRRLAAAGADDPEGGNLGGTSNTEALKALTNATVLSSENSQEVARYYSKLEALTKKRWEASLKTELRDKEAREHWSQQVSARTELMSTRGRSRDDKVRAVQTHRQELEESRRDTTEKRMQREQERMDAVLERKRHLQEEARERGLTRGEQQRSAAAQAEQRRLDKIAEKNQEKSDAQAELSARRFQEKQLHDFEAHLNALMSRDTQLRASRASEYRKEVFNERVQLSNYRANKRQDEMHDKFHEAMVQRDAVHRMKEQLDSFFSQLPKRPAEATPRFSTKGEIGGDLKVVPPRIPNSSSSSLKDANNNNSNNARGFPYNTNNDSPRAMSSKKQSAYLQSLSSSNVNIDVLPRIEPPSWLAKEVGMLNENQKERRKKAVDQQRSVIIKNNNNGGGDGEGSESGRKQFKRAQHATRWPYTAPESESKVAYPKWMYQSD